MKPAVEACGVSKRFRLGAAGHQPYHTLREAMTAGASRLTGWLGGARNGATADDLWALRGVDFAVHPGEVVGIVGRNGAGKSTLLKVLSRITAPTEGEVVLRGRVGSLLEVGTGFHPELTGRENVYLNGSILGMTRREIARKFDAIVAFAEVERFLDTPVKRYSSGMYVRLAFAVAAHLEPEILIVDEVLAVGDAAFQKKCLGKMEEVGREGRTILFVSHNMTAVKSLCTRAILIDGGKLALDGPTDEVVNRYLRIGLDPAGGGVIPATAPRYRDTPGEATVRSVRVTDRAGMATSQLYFGQPFRVEFECDVERDIPDGHFEVSISTTDGTHVTYSTTIDGATPPAVLRAGRHRLAADIDAVLLPRDYTVDLGVHHHDGMTCDFVQRTAEFTVLRVAEAGEDHYRWPRTRGHVRVPAKWTHTPPGAA